MKYALILPDGAADEPLPDFGDRTPLEIAETPYIDAIVETGRIGVVRTVPDGFVPGSDVATMSLLGYDVRKHYTGRAPIEAVARNIRLKPEDVVFRCNLVYLHDGEMTDFTAGHITTAEADRIIRDLNAALGGEGVRFHTGVSYRNLMVVGNPEMIDAACMPPHDIPHEPVADYQPKGRAAAKLVDLMRRAADILVDHEVNHVRRDLGEVPANAVWLWGQGVVPILPRFRQRFGVRGAVIAAVDLIRGLGKLLGWPLIDVPGATGYLDTDYAAKGRFAVTALDQYDLVTVHVEAPDEAGHMGDAHAKIKALAQIDEHIVGPVLEKLRTFERWRILIAPDHPTPVGRRTHTDAPPPFCISGSDVARIVGAERFSERAALAAGLRIDPGHELMEYFLHG